jgi:hypothetical protein
MPANSGPINKRTVTLKLRDLKLLELNARYMRHETFHALIDNIRQDGGLMGATPFACRVGDGETELSDGTTLDGKYLVLSGNHRVMAAIEAGIEFEDVTITDDDLPEERRTAIQLSQNAITGEDDPTILKQLYESMDSIDWRQYAGLDDKTLGLLDQVEVGSLNEADLSFQTISVMFLPDEADRMREAFDAARDHVGSSIDEAWLGRIATHDKLLDALDITGRSYGVKNIAVALEIILEVFERNVTDLSDGYLTEYDEPRPGRRNHEKKWVPLETLFGRSEIPVAASGIVRRAIKQMTKNGDITEDNLWQAIEYMSAEYLSGLGEALPESASQVSFTNALPQKDAELELASE